MPVFLADIKGDLFGMATSGVANEKVSARAKDVGFRSMLRSAGTILGREVTRSIFGTARRRR